MDLTLAGKLLSISLSYSVFYNSEGSAVQTTALFGKWEDMNFSLHHIWSFEVSRKQHEVVCDIFASEWKPLNISKEGELTQLVAKNYRQRSLPAFVINEAKSKLESIFAYEMRELKRTRPSNQTRPSQNAKSYFIISKLPTEIYKKYVGDGNGSQLTDFTFVVIGIVHLAGGKISEDLASCFHQTYHRKSLAYLRRLGLSENDEGHPVLGNITQALETLVQQRYLQKDRVNGSQGNTFNNELADGTVNNSIKEYISEIVQKDATSVTANDEWLQQWRCNIIVSRMQSFLIAICHCSDFVEGSSC